MLTSCFLEFNRVLQSSKARNEPGQERQDRTVRHSIFRFQALPAKAAHHFFGFDAVSREAQETYGFLFCN
ncbi:MAG TPA: hypothetical protein DFK19_12475 [Ochrobactrum sp.]|nr:hypothetical protein [Ochrobactrum sp.]